MESNGKLKKETLGKTGMFKQRYLSSIGLINTEIKRLNNILQGKDSLSYYDFEKTI